MNRWRLVLVVVILGLALGYLARDIYEGKPDRVAKAIEVFRTYCIPLANGEIVPPAAPLVPMKGPWADSVTGISVEVSKTRCAVSDSFDHLDASERQALTTAVTSLIEDEFPMLQPEGNVDVGWDQFLLWAQYPVGDPRRWGVRLNRFAESGDGAATYFTVSRPRNPVRVEPSK